MKLQENIARTVGADLRRGAPPVAAMAIGACLAAAVWAPPATAQKIATLGTLGGPYSWATGINSNSQMAGHSWTAAGYDDAFLYAGGVMTKLGTFGGVVGPNSVANAINASGQIVGYAWSKTGNGYHAFLYSGGVMTDLGTLPGGSESYAFGINASGQVVGYSDTKGGAQHAFLYFNGFMTDLGTLAVPTPPATYTSAATGINASGQIVGYSETASGDTHAFLYSAGVMTDLGTLPGGSDSYGFAINDGGQIVGYSLVTGGVPHAFLYSGGSMSDLGTLPGGTSSAADAINSLGQIVGYSDIGGGVEYASARQFRLGASTGSWDQRFRAGRRQRRLHRSQFGWARSVTGVPAGHSSADDLQFEPHFGYRRRTGVHPDRHWHLFRRGSGGDVEHHGADHDVCRRNLAHGGRSGQPDRGRR